VGKEDEVVVFPPLDDGYFWRVKYVRSGSDEVQIRKNLPWGLGSRCTRMDYIRGSDNRRPEIGAIQYAVDWVYREHRRAVEAKELRAAKSDIYGDYK